MSSEGPNSKQPNYRGEVGSEKKNESKGAATEKEAATNRPDLYVIARIISVLKEKGSLNRTVLATDTGLAYNRLSTYLDWMSERGFLRISEEGLVSLTAEGIETYEDLVRWILRYVGKLKFPRLT